ncbi:MAG: C40 family peptidase [Nitrospirae bacterium]|nr:C40 family peptidase [Nitrospirota bacterium]
MFDDLIGIPYVECGRTLQGLDCFGLVLICQKRLGIEAPDPFLIEHKKAVPENGWSDWIIREFSGWVQIKKPIFAAVIVFANKDGIPDHAGVMIDERRFIHSVRKAGVVIGRLDRCPYPVIGAYEYRRA